MVKAIRVHELGGPEVLKWEDVEIGEPKEGEIRVKNKAIGLNFIDVYFRKGVYKASTMPFTPGMEAAGVVTAVGPGLTGRKVGDVVAYAGNPMGSYAEEQILPAEKVVTVPPSLDPIVAASVILKGMTAHMLVRRCFKSSGMPDPLPMTELAAKSLFLTRASVLSYTATRDELLQAAGEVFSNVASGILRVRINHKYPLSQVAQAHEDLEGRKTSGSVVLIPDGVFEQSTIKATARAISASAPEAATMVKAIRVHELGGPEVLKWEDVEIGEPKEGEIRVKNKAIGLNFVDVYFRKGVYKASTMPFTPGREAAGVVTAVGPGLTGRKVGDVVAYAGNPMGSYAEEQILPAEKVVTVPPSLDPIVAASVILKGMTVHMLVRQCFKSSGMPDPLPMTELAAKSLFLTRASLFSYTATRDELLQAAGEVFSNVASGILRVRINHKYPLSQVAQAHEDLEGRKTSGSVVLIPDGVFEQ
ncbi:hypothetical protein C3L33_03068, partial [Rhododendron williamsianum]